MTGAGEARGRVPGGELRISVRSVNARALVVKTRLPPELQDWERDVERLVRARLDRGTVSLSISLRHEVRPPDALIDATQFAAVAAWLNELAAAQGVGGVSVADVLAVPGVLKTDGVRESTGSARVPPEVEGLVGEALDALVADRAAEGAATATAMLELLDALERERQVVVARAPLVVERHRDRLLARVNEFLAAHGTRLEPADIVRELGLFADRVDVTEELQRLGTHVERVRETLTQGGVVGRRLEFMLQEVLREVNTLGSKSPDVEIAHSVVTMKTAIDRLKEQAANLE